MKYSLGILLLVIVLCFSCKEQTKPSNNTLANQPSLSPDFTEFYEQFHKDSLFQVAHVSFPLAGKKGATDNPDNVIWTAEEWRMHKLLKDSDTKTHDFKIITSTLLEEYILTNNGLFGMVRRFSKMSDGWQLIYYEELNNMDKMEFRE